MYSFSLCNNRVKSFALALTLASALLIPRAGLAEKPAVRQAASQGVSHSEARPEALEKIEKAIDAKRQELHVPGASLVIVKDDKVIYIQGLGLRDVEHKLPVTPDTLFAIGSSTKAFTAMTVMMSADEGKLALTDPPRKYLPYFKMRDPEADSKITLSDLLCHRSGLDRTDLAWYSGKLNSEETLRLISQVKPTAKFGEKFQYQNVMFLAAGECVAKAQGAPWRRVVAKRIFQPLGMKATNTSIPDLKRAKEASLGYTYDAEKKETVLLPYRDLPAIAPAGAINSNAVDMAQWLRLMLGGGVFEGKRLVSEQNFSELFKPRITIAGTVGYGYGWFLRDWNGHKVAEHAGNIDGFNAQVALMPDQKLGFVLLTNVSASPLGSFAMNTIWDNLVEHPKQPAEAAVANAGDTGTKVAPENEAGTYRVAEANLDIVVAFKNGKLTAHPTGQPELGMENIGGRRYKLSAPAPDGFFLTFRPAKEDPKATEMFLEQPGAKFVCKKVVVTEAPAFVSPLPVDELMQKVIAAAGGEANLSRHTSSILKYSGTIEQQGLTAQGVLYSRAPNLQTDDQTLLALKKKVGTIHNYYDGKQGGTDITFAPPSTLSGEALDDLALSSAYNSALNWKKLFKTVTVKRLDKVGEEEVYVVEKTPFKGHPVTDYVSTKTFLVLKRQTLVSSPTTGGLVPVAEVFSDFRPVDGVVLPFQRSSNTPGLGDVVLTITHVAFDKSIPDAVFQPLKAKSSER